MEMGMKYYGLLLLVLACFISSVLVEGENLFGSEFFTVAYAAMAFVLITGSKHQETTKVDALLGTLIIFSIGFMSTEVLIDMLTNKFMDMFVFKTAIIVSLDYAALGFLRSAIKLKKMGDVIGDGRYAI